MSWSMVGLLLLGACHWSEQVVPPLSQASEPSSYIGLPFVLTTWAFDNASDAAWQYLKSHPDDPVQAVVEGCSVCETLKTCGRSVGYGDKPDEKGEVSLDAMIMDGKTMKAGGVGFLTKSKVAIRVAQAVLKYTRHTLLTGRGADEFAAQMGFEEEVNLTTAASMNETAEWTNKNCQPNKWLSGTVNPDPSANCGPYTPVIPAKTSTKHVKRRDRLEDDDHDTIGMVVVAADGHVASGTSTNGLAYKIHGRVGDSPIPGAGAYAENGVGGAVSTGDGDVMLRFAPSFYAVDKMRDGYSARQAAQLAINRITAYYDFSGVVLAVDVHGEHGAACHGYAGQQVFVIRSPATESTVTMTITCPSSTDIGGALPASGRVTQGRIQP